MNLNHIDPRYVVGDLILLSFYTGYLFAAGVFLALIALGSGPREIPVESTYFLAAICFVACYTTFSKAKKLGRSLYQ